MNDTPRAKVATVPAVARERLAAFRRARRANDALPALVRKTVEAQPQFGENSALSRRVGRMFLVPGDGVIGVYDEAGGGSVTDIASVLDGQAVSTTLCVPPLRDGELGVTGLLSEGASEPALVLRDGRRRPLTVTQGVYEVAVEVRSASDLPVRVEWTVAGERRSAELVGADESVLAARCRSAPLA